MTANVFKSEEGRRVIHERYREILNQAPIPVHTRFVATNHGRTHVIEAGPADAPPLLLLHGTSSNSASWFGDMPIWCKYFHIVAADMPGEPGLSEERRLRLAGDDVSSWLSSLLDEIGIEETRIVGMSLGGWSALRFAASFPDRVAALSLIASSGLAPATTSFVLKALPLLLLGDWGIDRVNRMVYGAADVPDVARDFGRLVGRHFRPVTEAVPVLNDDEFRRLGMPVQYIGGLQDCLLRSEESAKRLGGLLPDAEIHLLDSCGHVVLGQSETILEFLLDRVGCGSCVSDGALLDWSVTPA